MALGSAQPLTEMFIRISPWGGGGGKGGRGGGGGKFCLPPGRFSRNLGGLFGPQGVCPGGEGGAGGGGGGGKGGRCLGPTTLPLQMSIV